MYRPNRFWMLSELIDFQLRSMRYFHGHYVNIQYWTNINIDANIWNVFTPAKISESMFLFLFILFFFCLCFVLFFVASKDVSDDDYRPTSRCAHRSVIRKIGPLKSNVGSTCTMLTELWLREQTKWSMRPLNVNGFLSWL